jgi:predicted nucleic acid-binding protein
VLSFLRGEPAASRVQQAIEAGATCSWINLGEALYLEARRFGWDLASEVIDSLAQALAAEPADPEIVRAAAAVKAAARLSYADCFAVATAERHGAPLLTGDPELVELDRPKLKLVDLRA